MKVTVVPFERKLARVIDDGGQEVTDPDFLRRVSEYVATSPNLKVCMQDVFMELSNRTRQSPSSTRFNIFAFRTELAQVTAGVLKVSPEAAFMFDLTQMDRETYLALKKALDALGERANVSVEESFSDMLMNARELYLPSG